MGPALCAGPLLCPAFHRGIWNICGVATWSLFSRTTDISLSNYSGDVRIKSDATNSNAPSVARVVLFEHPVQTLLTDKWSNKKA